MIPAMERLARVMVDKCGGLPLAVVVLSGLLSHKRRLEEWQKVKDQLLREMKDESIEISDILSLSYNDLPTELKQCFLYCGIYPEDHKIDAESIMWLWMAEGLIPIRGEEKMEEIAKDILNELIRRSLIQVAGTFWEEVTRCRIHDLLRDLAVQKALEVNFLDIYNPRKHSISSLCFRHVINGQTQRYLSLDFSNLNLRSIISFDIEDRRLDQIKFHKMFHHLYVLHLDTKYPIKVPHAIGSWDLFFKKLLDVRVMVPTMEKLARDMLDKCAGLPLAIVVLSGLLSYKWGLEDWEKVKAHLRRHMKDDSIKISDIVSLSYNDLSTVLKQCFLYFGIYPEDHLISAENIMWMWIGEGLVPRGEERMEDLAKDILNELIRRNLIQVAKTYWEQVTYCRIHDLLRDLAVEKASELNLFEIYDPRKHSMSSLCFRHIIHDQAQRYLSLDFSNLNLRLIIFFNQEIPRLDQMKFRKMFQHLYVLQLENTLETYLAHSIGSLYHLKYLCLRTPIVPSSIGNLKNLQTLQVLNGTCIPLPAEIANLTNLRHLVAQLTKPLQHINKLTSLQILKCIRCDQWKDVDPVDLVNLQELSMNVIKKSYSLNNISSLKSLSSLQLCCDFGESFPALKFLMPPFPNSITIMVLAYSGLMEDPMPILGKLPNLRHLDLERAYKGKEISCDDNSFCQLEFLRLQGLSNVERWNIGTSAMPRIKGLGIHGCPELNEIPLRMKDVAILERL